MSKLPEQVIDLAREGLRPAAISAQTGCTLGYVSVELWRARKAGVDIPRHNGRLKSVKPPRAPKPRVPRRRLELIDLAIDGHTPRQIAAIMDIKSETVSSMLSRARAAGVEIPMSKSGRPPSRSRVPSGRGRGRPRLLDAA